MTPADVEKFVASYERVREALTQKTPRRAAKALCEELKWLVNDNGAFWARVPEMAATLEDQRDQEKEVLSSITRFIDAEGAVFAKLGIDPARYGPILGDVYSALRLASDLDASTTDAAFKNLRERLDKATILVCEHSKGRIRQAVDWVVSWKGASIIAGAATAGANVAIALHGEGGAVSSVSIKAGVKIMQRDIDGLIDMF